MLHAYRKTGGVAVPVAIGITSPVWDEPANAREWHAGLSARGVNFGNQFDTPIGANQGPWVREQEMIRAAAAGFDWVRIPVRLAAWAAENTAGTISPSLWALLDPFVTLALKHFRRVEVENINYRWLSDQTIEAPETAWSASVDDHRLRNKNMVIQLGAHYKDWSTRLGLGPYNEPKWPHYDDGPYWTFVAETTAAIRAQGGNNATRAIMGCTTEMGAAFKLLNVPALADGNQVVQAHPYHPFEYTHQGAWGSPIAAGTFPFGDWVRSAVEMQVRSMALWSKARGIPVVAGEMGVFWRNIFNDSSPVNDNVGRAAYYRCAREACERYGVPLALFSWGSDFGVTDSRNDASSRAFLVGMQAATTGAPTPVTSGPLPRSLAYVTDASKFTAPLGNGSTFDPIEQEVTHPAGGASWGDHLAVCDGKPQAGVTYQIANGGFGGNNAVLSWCNDFADVAGTRGGDAPSCPPGFVTYWTIPAGTTISNTARFLINYANSDTNAGSTKLHVTIKP